MDKVLSYLDLKAAIEQLNEDQLAQPVTFMLEVQVNGISHHPYANLATPPFFDSGEDHPVLLPTRVVVR